MKNIGFISLCIVLFSGCGHYRQTIGVDTEMPVGRPTKKYRIVAVKEMLKGKDCLSMCSDESLKALYSQREKEFISSVCTAYPNVFSEGGDPITVIRNNDFQNVHLGVGGILNVIVAIPTLLTIPIIHDSEWSHEITVVLNGKKSSSCRVTERVEMCKTGPIPIALCFPYSVHPGRFCVTGIKGASDMARTESMKQNEGRANGMAIIKQLIEMEIQDGCNDVRPIQRTLETQADLPIIRAKSSVIELDQIPL